MSHYASRANHGIRADGDAGQDDRVAADPHIIADCDRLAVFIIGTARVGMDRMSCGVDRHIRREHTVVADFYLRSKTAD